MNVSTYFFEGTSNLNNSIDAFLHTHRVAGAEERDIMRIRLRMWESFTSKGHGEPFASVYRIRTEVNVIAIDSRCERMCE